MTAAPGATVEPDVGTELFITDRAGSPDPDGAVDATVTHSSVAGVPDTFPDDAA